MSQHSIAVVLALLNGALAVSCATPRPVAEPAAVPPLAAPPPPVVVPAAPSPVELEVSRELRADVDAVVGLGTRSWQDLWNLAEVTDHLAERLFRDGYEVSRRGFVWQDTLAQNLEVGVPGRRRGDEVVVIGASFDSNPGSPGADDNATGVSAVLSLARYFARRHHERAIRFVLFSSAGPRNVPEAQGAHHYTKQLAAEGKRVVAFLELRGLGYYSSEGRQALPKGLLQLGHGEPLSGQFVALVSHPGQSELAADVGALMANHSSAQVRQWVLPESEPFVAGSAQLTFVQAGLPGLLVTDTQRLRLAAYGTPTDRSELLDFDTMARVVVGLRSVVSELAMPGIPLGAPAATGVSVDGLPQ